MKRLISLFIGICVVSITRGQVYQFQPSPINQSLLQNAISAINKDEMGFLWITTQAGIYRYDGKNVTLVSNSNEGAIRSQRFGSLMQLPGLGLTTYNEYGLFRISKGQVCAVRNAANEVYINSGNNIFKTSRLNIANFIPAKTSPNESEFYVSQVYCFANDTILRSFSRLYSVRQKKFLAQLIRKDTLFLSFNFGKKVFQHTHDGIYRAYFNGSTLSFTKVLATTGSTIPLNYTTGAGFWLSDKKHLFYFDAAQEKITKDIQLNNPNIDYISSAFETEQTLYIGTGTHGLFEGKLFNGKIFNPSMGPSEKGAMYTYFYNGADQHFYGIYNNSLIKMGDPVNKTAGRFGHLLQAGSLWLDSRQHAWVSEYNGLSVYDIDLKGRTTSWTYQLKEGILRIRELSDGLIYGCSDKTLYRINPLTHVVDSVFSIRNRDRILCFDLAGNKFYICTDNGLLITDRNGQVEKQLLPGKFVRCLVNFGQTRFILGTYGNGSFLLDGDTITPLPPDKQRISNTVVGLSKDYEGDLWILCNKGAFVWKKESISRITGGSGKEKYALFLQTKIELPVDELNGADLPPVFPGKNICLPSSDGLVVFEKPVLLDQSPTLINLWSVYVDDKKVDTLAITVKPNHFTIRFQLDIPYYGSDNNFNLAYRISGLDENWKPLDVSRAISLNKLAYGNYVLEIKNIQSEQPILRKKFTVSPFWYQTIYFNMLFVLLLITLAYIIIIIRTASLKKKQLQLEKMVAEKTEQLQDNLKVISESEKKVTQLYKNSNKLYSILMHDLKSPLQFLSNFTIDQFRKTKKNNAEDIEAISVIAGTSASLYKFITDFLFWLQNQNNNKVIQVSEFNLVQLITELVDFYSNISLINNNVFLFFHEQSEIRVRSDQELIKVVVRNLLDNANKYSENGVIKVSCRLSHDETEVHILIEDSGNGLPQHVLQLFLEEVKVDPQHFSIDEKYKMGVMITREFIELLQGRLSVKSSEEAGTSFDIIIPVRVLSTTDGTY